MLRVLYDGWSLVHQPDSPAALHLLSLLAYHPPDVQAWVALPGQPPEWLPDFVEYHIQPLGSSMTGQLRWEQRGLPRLAQKLGADGLHLLTSSAPLFGRIKTVVSPADEPTTGRPRGFTRRFHQAISQGGNERLAGIFWPEDLEHLPPKYGKAPICHMPVALNPYFSLEPTRPFEDLAAWDIPETYILYHGPLEDMALERLLSAWSWAAGPIGENYPLMVLGATPDCQGQIQSLLGEYNVNESVRLLPPISPLILPSLYQGAAALFHPASVSAWGGPLRGALAFGKPVVSIEDRMVEAIVGPAAYLAPGADGRALGAALISVIVEESVSQALSQAALQRSANWRQVDFTRGLAEAYSSMF